MEEIKSHFLKNTFLLAILIAVLFLFGLGDRPLSVPDEGRYMEIPREMLVSNDFITPRLNGVKYFEKPVLFYWLEAFSLKLFGINEFSGRLVTAFFAWLGALSLCFFGKRLFNQTTGFLSALCLSTTLLYYAFSRIILLDLVMTVFLTVGLLCFLEGIYLEKSSRRHGYFLGASAALACSVLTKGLIGLVLPGCIIGLWLLIFNQWHRLRPLYLPSVIGLFLLIAVPWHLAVGIKTPEFFSFYFIHEHFERYLTTVHNRFQPWWFFIPILIMGFFPWIFFLPQALYQTLKRAQKEEREKLSFLIIWAFFPLCFFSLSSSKLIPYILPVLPPLALIVGRHLTLYWQEKESTGYKWAFAAYSLLTLVISAGALGAAYQQIHLQKAPPTLWPIALILLGALCSGAFILPLIIKKFGFKGGIVFLSGVTALFLMGLNHFGSVLQKPSIKSLAEVVKNLNQQPDRVLTYHGYYQDLPVYLERLVSIVEWQGELAFGASLENLESLLKEEEFEKIWQSSDKVCLFANQGFYETLIEKPWFKYGLKSSYEGNYVLCNYGEAV